MSDSKQRTIEYIPLAELVTRLHPSNPKEHDIGMIIESFKTHGYVASGVIDDRTSLFLAGHGRTIALNMMHKQGMQPPDGIRNGGDDWLVPVQVGYSSKNDAQAKAYIIADNRLTTLGGWDEVALAEILQELANSDEIDIEASGYDADDLDMLLVDIAGDIIPVDDPGAQVDRAAELNKKWEVERGQIWEIPSASGEGVHRIMCGDSTSAEDVGLLMDGVKADAVVTDPPYNVAEFTDVYAQSIRKSYKKLSDSDWDHGFNPAAVMPVIDSIIKDNSWVYVFSGDRLSGDWFLLFDEKLDKVKICVWCKSNPLPSLRKSTWVSATELCVVGRRGSPIFNYPADGHALNWWNINIKTSTPHPTEKTIEVILHIITHATGNDDLIVDLFLGSGTTIVACEQTGRVGYGMEISPDYVSVCLERLAGMGLEPERITKNDMA